MTDIIHTVQLGLIFLVLILLIFQIRALDKKVTEQKEILRSMDRNLAFVDRTVNNLSNRTVPGEATGRPRTIAG